MEATRFFANQLGEGIVREDYRIHWSVVGITKVQFMITRFLNKNVASFFRATLVGSGILCFLVPSVGFYKIAGLGLGGAQSLLGFGVVVGLTIQTMILFAVIALAEKIFGNRQASKHGHVAATELHP